MQVIKRDGSREGLDVSKIQKATAWATQGLNVSQSELEMRAQVLFFDGMKTTEIHAATVRGAAEMISRECQDASKAAARLVLLDLYKRVNNSNGYTAPLSSYIEHGVAQHTLNPELLQLFDLNALNNAIQPERDLQFEYLGIQTLQDRYLVRSIEDKQVGDVIELPQHFFMRVAMGLAIREDHPTMRAIEFYDLLSSMDFMSSTPTLFNSGTTHSQLSSCYLNTVPDTLSSDDESNRWASIYGTLEETARLSKYAGGIGTDWNRVRATGDLIKGTGGRSSGPVPYMKVANDTGVAVNQGGKRPGSIAVYIEPWHPDLWAFCELKKKSGDDRLRCHELYPASWIPDLLMKRVKAGGVWSFFSPANYPELHELWGDAFEKRYEQLEREGKFSLQKPAMEVWKKMLSSLFETGHPWITFKDAANRRNPQQHVGVVHSSNLCTEITLNTSDTETAVCNLGSVNMANHLTSTVDGRLLPDYVKLQRTVATAMRMLDNVIDINFYPSPRAKFSNLQHRPVGLGVMGYTEFLVAQGIDWESEAHLDMADEFFEHMSYYAIEASCSMAVTRGAYPSFKGSLWSQGILPLDTSKFKDEPTRLSWDRLRDRVVRYGMRNSNCMAIAPTATISNIVGTTPCTEPAFELETVKSNLSGQFMWIDPSLRYGRPELCKTAFEVDQSWLIRAAAKRGKWIDQAQSLNLFAKRGTKGKDLSNLYMLAWDMDLKTTYYLRTQSMTAEEATAKAAADAAAANAKAATNVDADEVDVSMNLCSIDNPECTSCQ